MQTSKNIGIQQWANVLLGSTLAVLLWRFASGALLSQIGSNPVIFNDREWMYQLFIASGIPALLTSGSIVSALFDVVLVSLPILFLVTLRPIWAILFTIIFSLYFLTFNVVTGHHYHGLVGVLVITIPFWFVNNQERFALMLDGSRYYLLYIFSSAAMWKILRGSAFYPLQLTNILKAQQLDLLLQHPDSFKAVIVRYLIAHPDVSHMLLLLVVAIQLSFAVGFFTRKADKFLLLLLLLFFTGNYFVMGIFSFELIVMGWLLWYGYEQEKEMPTTGQALTK